MSIPDWIDEIEPKISDPYVRLIKKIKSQDEITTKLKTSNFSNSEQVIIERLHPKFTIIEIIVDAINQGKVLSELIKYLTWKEFEEIVATILKSSGWISDLNYRYFGEGSPSERNRYEVDIVSVKKPYVILIDCKKHKNPSRTPIKIAAENQKERSYVLFEQLPIIYDSLVSDFPKWKTDLKIIPLILTWRNHQLQIHERVPICSVDYFEDFIINLGSYIEEFNLFCLDWKGNY